MHGDAISPPQLREHGEGDGIRFHRAPGLADVRDVVNVDPETGHTNVRLSGSYAGQSQS